MIPKQLFFIWFGDNKPDYVNYCVNTFKSVNDDFSVDLIEYKKYDIENFEKSNDDILIKSCLKAQKSKDLKNNRKNFLVLVSDTYRQLLLLKYGGIYLDCDTFPLKKFDEKLLKLDAFKVTQTLYNSIILGMDIFFMGHIKTEDNLTRHFELLSPPLIMYNDSEYIYYRNKFYNLELKYGEYNKNKYSYIEHFRSNEWKKTTRELCIYDNMEN